MPNIAVNSIRIEYETFGQPQHPTVILIMGYAAHMKVWPDSFCKAIASQSFHVIRFDNRDCGLSGKFDGRKCPGMIRSMLAYWLKMPLKTPYTLEDMALDAVGLLEALQIDSAHFVGVSMGGMIAQLAAVNYPARVRSLTSIMSSSGSRHLPGPKPAVLRQALFGHKSHMNREQAIDYLVRFCSLVASPGFPTAEDERRRLCTEWVSRAFDPQADRRQFAAMTADGDRSERLARIRAPTLVLHGGDDPLIPVAGGRHTAACIAGSRLEIIPGMGHDLPEALVPVIVPRIIGHLKLAEQHHASESARG